MPSSTSMFSSYFLTSDLYSRSI